MKENVSGCFFLNTVYNILSVALLMFCIEIHHNHVTISTELFCTLAVCRFITDQHQFPEYASSAIYRALDIRAGARPGVLCDIAAGASAPRHGSSSECD